MVLSFYYVLSTVFSALAEGGGAIGQGHTAHQWGGKGQDARSPAVKSLLLNTVLSFLDKVDHE